MNTKTIIKTLILIIALGILMLLAPINSYGYNFYCTSDSGCHPYNVDPYGRGDSWKSVAGIYHQMKKNGSAWLTSTPVYANWYRGEDVSGGWNGTATVDSVGGICYGHNYAGRSGGWCKVKTVIDVNESNKSVQEQLLGYAAYKSTSKRETGRVAHHKNQIRKWLWDFYPSYGGTIQHTDSNRREDYNTTEASRYANSAVKEAFSTTSKEVEGAKQTIEYKNGYTFIGPYNLKMVFGTMSSATINTRDGRSYTTTYCSTNGSTIRKLSDISSYSGNNFYVVIKGTSNVDSVKGIKLTKSMNVVSARVAISETVVKAGQYVAVFYGERGNESKNMNLPGVPFSAIRIKKTDTDSNKGLKNVGFIVYNETEKKWVKDGVPAKLVNSRDEATVYRTNSSGEVTVRNLNKKGKYVVYEIVNPNFGYVDTSIDDPCNIVETNINAIGQTITLNIKNKRMYIKLSGYVWEDLISATKENIRDNLYTSDTDKLLENVLVSLRDKNGNLLQAYDDDGNPVGEIQPRRTDSEGKYMFGNYWAQGFETEKIRIQDIIDGAYIEFEYNGMSYKSVPLNPNANNGSKATDDVHRNKSGANNQYFYSTRYATVTSNEATDTEGRVTSLEYDYANNRSTLKYADSTSSYIYGYAGQKFPIDGIYNKYKVFANTRDANNGIMGKGLTGNDIYKNNMEEIPYINLGVYEREMPDLAVMQDIENVQLTLNGYKHTYNYDQRFDNGSYTENGQDGFNVAVKFGDKYMDNSYTREIYSSDLVYNGLEGGDTGVLGVYITYKIAIRNEATEVYTRINELSNYYDSRYEIQKIGTQVDEHGDIIGTNINIPQNVETIGEYTKSIIDLRNVGNINPISGQNNTMYIYIQYKLNNDAVNTVLNGEITGETTLKSVTEVVSYSSFEGGFNTVYSGVDRDSRPNSISPNNPNDRTYYEDDTDSAPAMQLVSSNTRIIQGTIWEEDVLEELINGTGYDRRREGDGSYDTQVEDVVNNVEVELISLKEDGTTETAKLYQKGKDTGIDAKYVTGATEQAGQTGEARPNGTYIFDGVIPGQYFLKYTYGENSVLYDTEGNRISGDTFEIEKYKSTKFRNYENEEADENDQNLYWYRTETSKDANAPRWSDAKDLRGIYGDGEVIDIVERRTTTDNVNYEYATKENTLTEIESETKHFDIKLDYDVNLDNISDYGADLKFNFDNMDFGIVRRPVQEIQMIKEISYIEVILANGQTIIRGDPRTDDIEHLRMLPQSGNVQQGRTVYIEVDQEIIQGATLKLTYDITVNLDNCEVDYNDSNYYYYNHIEESWNNSHEDGGKWEMAIVRNLYDYVADDLNFDEENQVFTDEEGNVIDIEWVSVNQEELQEGVNISSEALEELQEFVKILKTDYFADMNPENREKVGKLQLTRILSNNELDFVFDNDIEINNSGGRIPDDAIPGNYNPSESPNEQDESEVQLIITGPTGENQQYIPYIILIISSAIIAITGIIFIKKKIIKND